MGDSGRISRGVKADLLWPALFFTVFINGFEAGGYQASLWHIGQTYNLSVTQMGIYASVELFATMLAPIILGSWADRSIKTRCIEILLGLQMAASALVFFTSNEMVFVGGVFFLGMSTSALQFISIAALSDAYPVSGKSRIGYMTSMYALGALTAPLIVSSYLKAGMSWRTLFVLLLLGSVAAFAGIRASGGGMREAPVGGAQEGAGSGAFILVGVLLLCVVMCIYVGFENGFAFFVDTMFQVDLQSAAGKYALSLFWAVMIPSRLLAGYFSRYCRRTLLLSVVAIPCITAVLSFCSSGIAVLLLCIPLGFACGAVYPSVLAILITYAGKKTATATGMLTSATGIGGFAFTALTGVLADHLGVRRAMLALSCFFLFSIVSVLSLRRIRAGE